MDITERERNILFAIIEEYSETASPIGSVTLAKLFNVSSATIRAEMSRLEDLGYLSHPHTSAGRIPTDKGYRFYVNSLTESSGQPTIYDLEHNIDVRHMIGSGERDHSNFMQIRIGSQSRADYAIKSAVNMLVELTGNLGLGTIGDQLYLAGISRLFAQPEFVDSARIQSVAKLLDNLEPWLREARPGEPLNIYIGSENPIGKTSGVSLIISKFRSPYSDKSYIGVLGPTRQNYAKVMSLVRSAGNILEDTLN